GWPLATCRSSGLRSELRAAMTFWLKRAVAGFRVDLIYHLIKDDLFRYNPLNPVAGAAEQSSHALIPLYTTDRPEVQDVIVEMRRVTDEFGGADSQRILIGEIYLPLSRLMAYYGPGENGILQ